MSPVGSSLHRALEAILDFRFWILDSIENRLRQKERRISLRLKSKIQNGFTLVELLVVLMLMGLTSAMVLPAMERVLERRELRQSVLGLAAVARNLRSRALSESTIQRLVVDPSENSYQIFSGNKVALPDEVKITGVDGGEPLPDGARQFVFFPNGSILGGEIDISGHGLPAYRIRLESLSGRVILLEERSS